MAVKLPKYAHWVAERRFVVDAARLPPLDPASARTIEDLYIDGGRLRLAGDQEQGQHGRREGESGKDAEFHRRGFRGGG